MRIIIFLSSLSVLLAACQADSAAGAKGTPQEPPAFQETLNEHLAALKNRDLAAYERTLTLSDDFSIIFPGGERTSSRRAALEFHENWFEDKQWRMDFEEVWRSQTEYSAVVLIKTSYRDTPEGAARQAWLTLYFELQNNSWRLVHDQNTAIQSLQ